MNEYLSESILDAIREDFHTSGQPAYQYDVPATSRERTLSFDNSSPFNIPSHNL
jgi:hypothetical protein